MKSVMKKIFLFVVVVYSLTLTTYTSYSQKGSNCPDDLVPTLGDNRMWGYKNLMGHWVIQPSYTKVSPYVESKAVVQKGLKFGVIDCDGNVILHPEYDKLTNFKYGKIWAMKNGMWGLLNEKGGTLLEHQYSQINPIAYTELSWVKKGDLWGLLNEEKGTFICKPQFKIAQIMSENATLVQLKGPTFGVINHVDCGYLLQPTITKVKKVAAHTIIFEQENKWGVFNEYGKTLAVAEYDSIVDVSTFTGGTDRRYDLVLKMKKNNQWGLMNMAGKIILTPQYDEISDYRNNFFRVKQNGKYGYSNRIGKVYIKPQYEEASLFSDDQAIVKKNGKYGVINYKNEFILPASYPWIERNFAYKYYVIREKDNAGKEKNFLYGLNSKKLSVEAFDSVFVSDSVVYVRVKKENKIRFYNVATATYSFEGSYDNAEPFYLGYARVARAGKWGVIDVKGKEIVPLNFDKVEYDWMNKNMVFKTVLNGKFGITEHNGKVMLGNEYELIAPSAPIYLKVKKDGKYGVMKNTGTPVTEFTYDFISNVAETPGVPEWPAIVVVKGKYGMINEKGEIIFEPKAVKIEYLEENLYSAKEKKDYFIINAKGQPVGEEKFTEIREFHQGYAPMKKGGKWGFVDRAGAERIKPQYEDAGLFIDYMAPVQLNGLWGVIDTNGKELVKPEYEKYITMPDGTRKFYKGGNEYTLGKGGVMR